MSSKMSDKKKNYRYFLQTSTYKQNTREMFVINNNEFHPVFGSMSYLLSITPVFCHHLSQCLQNLDTQSLLIFLQQLLGMFDQPAQPHYFVSLITRSTVVYYMPYFNWYLYCLLAYKPAALALLARVCVFGEEQLRPMQDIHQD